MEADISGQGLTKPAFSVRAQPNGLQLLYTIGGLENYRAARKYYSAAVDLSGGKNIRALYGVVLVRFPTSPLPAVLCNWGCQRLEGREDDRYGIF